MQRYLKTLYNLRKLSNFTINLLNQKQNKFYLKPCLCKGFCQKIGESMQIDGKSKSETPAQNTNEEAQQRITINRNQFL